MYGTREKRLRVCVCVCPFRRCTGGGIDACGADGRSSLVVVAATARWGGSKCVRATCVFIILYLLTSLTCCRWRRRRRQWWYSLVNVLRVKHLLFFFHHPPPNDDRLSCACCHHRHSSPLQPLPISPINVVLSSSSSSSPDENLSLLLCGRRHACSPGRDGDGPHIIIIVRGCARFTACIIIISYGILFGGHPCTRDRTAAKRIPYLYYYQLQHGALPHVVVVVKRFSLRMILNTTHYYRRRPHYDPEGVLRGRF